MIKHHGGFTLIEVMISVVIISVVGFTMLQTHANSIYSLSLFAERMKANEYSSLLFTKISKDLNNKTRDLYEFIQDQYVITDDDLLKFLKKHEFLYKQKELYFMRLGDSSDIENEELMQEIKRQDENGETVNVAEGEGVSIEQITVSNILENNISSFVYHFTFERNNSK